MSRKAMTLVVMVAMLGLIVAVAGLVWGAMATGPHATGSRATGPGATGSRATGPGATAARPSGTRGGDFSRCPATCNTLMRYYGEKRPTLTAHEGDTQCWRTCDLRFNRGKNAHSASAMKAFWLTRKDTTLHANQCAQACWRRFHNGSDTVTVAGLHSTPRAVVCAPGASRTVASAR